MPPGSFQLKVNDQVFLDAGDGVRLQVADGRETSGVQVRAARGGTIRGHLIDAGTRQPITSKAQVSIQAHEPTRAFMRNAGTSKSGAYEFTGLPAGSYCIGVDFASGYACEGKHDPVAVSLGQTVERVDIALEKGGQAWISGSVLNPDGSPAPHATIWLEMKPTDGGTIGWWSGSAADGTFSIKGKPETPYTLCAFTHDYLTEKLGPLQPSETSREGLSLQLRPAAAISGKVVGEGGQPLPDTKISFRPIEPSGRMGRSTDTDADNQGRFECGPLWAGTYRISIWENAQFGGHLEPEPETITVADGQKMQNLKLTAVGLGSLSIVGRVTDPQGAPIPSGSVRADRVAPPFGPSSQGSLGPDGCYEISGLTASSYRIDIQCEGYEQASRRDVSAGSTGVDFVLVPTATVSGQILNARTGQPAQEYRVGHASRWDPANLPRSETSFDPDGRFTIKNIPASDGSAVIMASAPGLEPGHAIVEVRPGRTTEGVTIRLNPSAILEGRVVNAAGAPVQDAQVFVEASIIGASNKPSGKPDASTGANGEFELDSVAPSVSRLVVWHEEYALAETAFDPAAGAISPIVLLAPGAIEAIMECGGKPAAKQQVKVSYEPGTLAARTFPGSGTTDEDGRCLIEGLIPGKVTVAASYDDVAMVAGIQQRVSRGQLNKPATIEAGQTTVLHFEQPRTGATIEGRLSCPDIGTIQAGILAEVTNPAGQYRAYAPVAADGRYCIENLPAGSAALLATIQLGPGEGLTKHLALEVPGSGTIRRDIAFQAAGKLRGTLSGLDGAERAYVMIFPGEVDLSGLSFQESGEWLERNCIRRTIIPENGPFEIPYLEPGTQTVLVATEGLKRQATAILEIPETGAAQADFNLR